MKIRKGIYLAVLLLSLTSVALANGLGGQRLEKVSGQYIIDVGTDQQLTPQAGFPIQFDFNLLRSNTREFLPYTTVNVRIVQGNKVLLDNTLPNAIEGPTLLVYTFPSGGDYGLEVAFYNDNQKIVDGSLPITIAGSGDSKRYIAASIFVIVLVGSIAGFVFYFRKKKVY